MDDQDQIRYLGDVQRLALQPGDIVVLKFAGAISAETHCRLKAMVKNELPGHKVLILDSGMEIGVLGKAA
jgi:hypothetical protein